MAQPGEVSVLCSIQGAQKQAGPPASGWLPAAGGGPSLPLPGPAAGAGTRGCTQLIGGGSCLQENLPRPGRGCWLPEQRCQDPPPRMRPSWARPEPRSAPTAGCPSGRLPPSALADPRDTMQSGWRPQRHLAQGWTRGWKVKAWCPRRSPGAGPGPPWPSSVVSASGHWPRPQSPACKGAPALPARRVGREEAA